MLGCSVQARLGGEQILIVVTEQKYELLMITSNINHQPASPLLLDNSTLSSNILLYLTGILQNAFRFLAKQNQMSLSGAV